MDDKQKRLIRNIAGGVVLLLLVVFLLAYCGVFEGEQSDEAQIRALIEQSREEVNDHDWDDFLDLTNVPEGERAAWIEAIPEQAKLVHVDSITPKGMLNVPPGATEFSMPCSALAHLEAPVLGRVGPQIDAVEGTIYFVKVDGRWRIDLEKSSTEPDAFPYVPRPKR